MMADPRWLRKGDQTDLTPAGWTDPLTWPRFFQAGNKVRRAKESNKGQWPEDQGAWVPPSRKCSGVLDKSKFSLDPGDCDLLCSSRASDNQLRRMSVSDAG